MRRLWLIPALLAPAALCQTVPVSSLLRVWTHGAVTVRGEDRTDVAYSLAGVKAARQGEWTELQVPTGAALELRVPRRLKRIRIESQGESVEAYDLEGSLEVDGSGARIRIDRVGGDVAVRTAGGEIRLGQVGGHVNCLSGGGRITAASIGGSAELNTEGGEIVVVQANGLVRASTGGGSIRVEQARQGVTLSTAGGLIDVGRADGPVVAQSGVGWIKVRSASNVQCSSGNGAIHLQAVSGALRASTAMGSIVAELASGKSLQDSQLATVVGDITVYIPSNVAVTVQAVGSARRRIVSDFAEIQPQAGRGSERAAGPVNGGGPLLRLSATDGTIYLRRR